MTVGAIISNWGMFPEFRATFFGMAAVAVFIDGHLFQTRIIQTAMGIVAITTDHLLPLQRVR